MSIDIYISTSCIKTNNIKKTTQYLYENGFTYIELSAGTDYYDGIIYDLIELKEKNDLTFHCHNYFPPPKTHFILNLASLDKGIFDKSVNHIRRAIDLSKMLGANKFGFHAGLFLDIKISELGKKIDASKLFDREKSIRKFCDAFRMLQDYANDIELYVENNVLSQSHIETFNDKLPFMLLNYEDYLELKTYIDYKLLLDVAHLKVSSKSLNLNFDIELDKAIKVTDYIHLSDNDGLHDQNKSFSRESSLLQLLSKYKLKDKMITLEIYDEIKKMRNSYNLVRDII